LRYPRRTWAWLACTAVLAANAYLGRAEAGKPPEDLLYRWDTALVGAIGYAVIAGAMLLIAAGQFELFALRRPRSWARSIGLAVAVLFGVLVAAGILERFLHAGEEQGFTPDTWEPSKAGQYAANFVVVAGLAPFVEELFFRGLGYSLLEQFGRWPAVVLVGVAFAAVHGLVAGFLVLALFGAALAWLRLRTGSVVPGMLVHAAFNAFALVVAVV
jgi:CAAX protease family protein